MASRKKPAPAERKKDGIHFVNARPESETERLRTQRLVRAHVGRWISDQTKDRSTPSESAAGPSRSSTHSTRDTISPVPPGHDRPGPHTYTLVSRPSPYSAHQVQVLPHGLPVSLEPPPEREWQPSPFPPSHASDSSDSSDDASIVTTRSSEPVAIVPWQEVSRIEPQISGNLDPFSTFPSNFSSDVVQLCESYCSCRDQNCFDKFWNTDTQLGLSVLWPGLIPARDHKKEAGEMWFPLSLSDPALFTAFMFASLCHQRVQWLNGWVPLSSFGPRQEQILERCEMESIRLISQAVHDPSRQVSDAVLLSVICMAHHQALEKGAHKVRKTPFNAPLQRLQWIDVYGCLAPNMIHIQGLMQLINLRGGLQNIKTLGLRPTISFSDILTACVLRTRPVFEFWPTDPNRNGISIHSLLGFDQSDVDHGFGRLQDIGVTPQMAEALQAAYTYIIIVQASLSTDFDRSLLADQRNLTQFNLLSVPPVAELRTYFSHPSQATTYEACRVAAMIFGVGVIFPIPAPNSPLHQLARQLWSVLCEPTASTLWTSSQTRMPLLWMLTLGGIAAHGTAERPLFASELRRTARRTGLSSWLDLKQVLEMMLWYDRACDEAAESLWWESVTSYPIE